ncbi:MAG: conjugal transfer protein TraG N-terminal domain-containing protein [Nitrospirae bacterium]|nr:conjugal transfer protein TraG N-terminal domain-containing protein [Nitrospirota bacterium]
MTPEMYRRKREDFINRMLEEPFMEVIEMKKMKYALTVLLLCSLFPASAQALDMEYYTYNGFDPIVTAFQQIALVLGDHAFAALFFSIIVLSIVFGGISFFYKMATGGKGGGLSWTIPILTGIVIWAGLILPKGTLNIYDPVLNRNQAVGGIPDGIIAIAGTLNLVERGLVDIIYTSGDPRSYQDGAGGVGFNAILKATSLIHMPNDNYIDDSLKNYTKDCLFFELQRPGTTLSVNDITEKSVDFFTQYSQGVNPAIYTVYYADNGTACPSGGGTYRNGCTMTCTDAWTNIQTYLSAPGNLDKSVRAVCAASGFNPDNASEMQKCDQIITSTVNYTSGNTISMPSWTFIRQAYMAQNLNNTLLSVNPDLAMTTLANRNMVASSIGQGVVANEWLPIIRAIVTSIAIGLIPFLIMFIPTPLFKVAIGTIAGFFVWLTAWGITDAITHSIAISSAYKIFDGIRQSNLGFNEMMASPNDAMKTLSMFGTIRTFGIMLATVLSGTLVKFGGHALAMMAGNISGQLQAQGASSAMKTETPEGHAGELKQTWDVMPTEAWANHHKWDNIAQTKIGAAEYGYSQQEARADMHQKYGDGIRDSLENQMAGQVGSGLQYGGVDNAFASGAQRTQSALGKQASERQKAEFFGFGDNVWAYEQWKDQGMVLDKAQAEHLKQEGMWGVESGMKIEERSFGLLSDSDGNLHVANLKASETITTADGMETKTFENGRLIERGTTSTGLQYERVTGQGGHITQESAQGMFDFGGRSLRGELKDTGGAYSFAGVDTASGQTVRMQGSASDIDLASGKINNWQAYHETGDKGSYDKLIMPKDEALKEFSALEGSDFYKGLQGMSDGQAVNVNVARDTATGDIATITADQGGRSAEFDHRSTLTGLRDTHEALKVVDTGLRKHTGTIDISRDEKHKIYDHRDVHKTGEEIVQGTGVSGEPGVFVLDPKKYTALSMIETGDSMYAQRLSEGSKVIKSANATVFAAGWSHEVSAFISRKGTKYDAAEADASVKAGFEALGMGATMQGRLLTGSKDTTSFNILSSGMNTVITHARETAAGRGLTEAEAIKHDVGIFSGAVMNEGLHTRTIRNPEKHMPVTDAQAQYMKQQSQDEPPHYKGIPDNPMTTRK